MKQKEKSTIKNFAPILLKPNWWFRFLPNEKIMERPNLSIFPEPYVFWAFKMSKSLTNELLEEEKKERDTTGQPYYILNKFYKFNSVIEKRGMISDKTALFYLNAGYIQIYLHDKQPLRYPLSKVLLYPQEPNGEIIITLKDEIKPMANFKDSNEKVIQIKQKKNKKNKNENI